ncbi:uncharacterized protein VTP21DRAFT_6670 [Calcarisporiella thermophila]|uniref:uncharacterized protein n=1 Tax=Calcarisporiella thermophila TaxID=911321 RepID=UPI003744910F
METSNTEAALVTAEQRASFKQMFNEYFDSLSKHLVKIHSAIRNIEKKNQEFLISKGGELTEERKQNHEKAVKLFEKLFNLAQTLAELLSAEMPNLPENEASMSKGFVRMESITFGGDKESIGDGVWQDEDERDFYENLLDLTSQVPRVLLEEKHSKKVQQTSEEPDKESNNLEIDAGEATEEKLNDEKLRGGDLEDEDEEEENEAPELQENELEKDTAQDNEVSSFTNPTGGIFGTEPNLDFLLARLPNMINRELIDKTTVEFCYMNSKGARKKLVKALLGVPRNRLDVLPYYARLIGTLYPHFQSIAQDVLTALEKEFKGLYRKKTSDFVILETRIKNIRFLSELTKFRITPTYLILHCIKMLLNEFNHQNAEVLCNLLETCGRFLFKSPETNARINSMLETMMRKKNTQRFDNRIALMIENAFYQCNPPEKSAMQTKNRPPMELFIRKLLYSDLSKKSLDKIVKLLRKLHWEDRKISDILLNIFSKIWKVKFGNIHLMAIVASGLNRHHSDFGVALVDRVLEEIRVGLEGNMFKHNQRRIATVKYLGELYIYRLINSPVIFETLWTIVTFGHEQGRPSRDRPCPLDSPDDFFRIRLCCTLLDTCGLYFDKGASKRNLDNFLTFFQMYIQTKHTLPMDVEFMVAETFSQLRPNTRMFESFDEAAEAVDRMFLEQLKKNSNGVKFEDGFESEASESTNDSEDEESEHEGEDREEEKVHEIEESAMEVDQDEDVVVLKNQEERIQEVDAQFDLEFSKLMAESLESRRHERKMATLDVPIPMRLQDRGKVQLPDQESGRVTFTLLTKKGNKQQAKTLELPANSALAVSTRIKQEAQREEQQHLKKLVLNYEEREEVMQRQSLEVKLAHRGIHLSFEDKNKRLNQKGRRLLREGGVHGYGG